MFKKKTTYFIHFNLFGYDNAQCTIFQCLQSVLNALRRHPLFCFLRSNSFNSFDTISFPFNFTAIFSSINLLRSKFRIFLVAIDVSSHTKIERLLRSLPATCNQLNHSIDLAFDIYTLYGLCTLYFTVPIEANSTR